MSSVSIVIPVYNRELKLRRAVESILKQTYQDFEIILVDDCSKDSSLAEAHRLASEDSRIKVFSHLVNKGAQAARNTGIRNSTGAWIGFLDSDDTYLPDSIEVRLNTALRNNTKVAHAAGMKLDVSGKLGTFNVPAFSGQVYKNILFSPGPLFQTLLIARPALEKIGLLDENIISWQEWDTSIRLAEYFEFAFVAKPSFIYDCSGTDTISKDSLRTAKGYEQIVLKHEKNIVHYLGEAALMNHYQNIAFYYAKAGDLQCAKKYWLRRNESPSLTNDDIINFCQRGNDIYNESFIEEHIISFWDTVCALRKKPVLFGAGQHSDWMLSLLKKRKRKMPSAILDDSPRKNKLRGVSIYKPDECPFQFDALILSTDVMQNPMRERAESIPGQYAVIDLYKGFFPGSYPKRLAPLETYSSAGISGKIWDSSKLYFEHHYAALLSFITSLCPLYALYGKSVEFERILNVIRKESFALPEFILDENSEEKTFSGIKLLRELPENISDLLIIFTKDFDVALESLKKNGIIRK